MGARTQHERVLGCYADMKFLRLLAAFTINLQGGSPEGYSKEQPW